VKCGTVWRKSSSRSAASGHKPFIAVLPFQNLSEDSKQEHLADGIVEEITTGLARIRWLSVIARNSTLAYGGRAVDVRQIGRELGARYVLEGSLRKEGNRIRVTGQLIDAATGAHLWADRFEGEITNLFDLQDEVTESVVGAIAPELQQAEIERARRKRTESLDAYDLFLRGMARKVADLAGGLEQPTSEGTSEALRLFYGAIELDPDFASAQGMAAFLAGRAIPCARSKRLQGSLEEPYKQVKTTQWHSQRAAMCLRLLSISWKRELPQLNERSCSTRTLPRHGSSSGGRRFGVVSPTWLSNILSGPCA
jgi:TolB-like protein